MFSENDLSNGFENSQNKPKQHFSMQDLENPDEKIDFNEKGIDFLKESEMGNVGFCLKPTKIEQGKGRIGNSGSQELTLSYLCDNPKTGLQEKEISGRNLLSSLDKYRYKGKEVICDSQNDESRLIERDFFQLSGTAGSKREIGVFNDQIKGEKRDKKAKLETLNLSLALPDVSLSLASSNPLPNSNPPLPLPKSRSIQSLAPSTNNTRTSSDDFTEPLSYSYSHSHPISHNPSCSLTRNSTEYYEYSVGSHRRENDQIWNCGEGTNGSVHSRFKPIGDGVILSNNGGFQPLMPSRGVNKDSCNSLYRANSSDNVSFFPSELPARQRRDTLSADSRGKASEQCKISENGFANSERPERILREIICESISVMAQIFHELPSDLLEAAKHHLKNLVGAPEKREEFTSLQRRLERRSDLTSDTLSKCHEVQLDILLTVKTGIADYLSPKTRLPKTELIEIFLLARCRNLNCKSLLPVDDCDCKICSTKKGFCSACMCPICLNFDCANNTCSWVGCDVCSHWCHAACGLQKNLIKPGPSLKGVASTTGGVQFNCLGCGHASEMFGFVKDVFGYCAKDWGLETLIKELGCVRKIFQVSEDFKGKELHKKVDEMLTKLEKQLISPSDACNSVLQFFKYGVSDVSVTGSSSKESLARATQRGDVSLPPPATVILPKSSYNTNCSSTTVDTHRETRKQEIEPEMYVGGSKKIDAFESLESIVRIKEAEARMFQNRADEARREAEGYRRIARAKTEKVEEEYATKLAKLCLQETEERRRKKLEELKALEDSQCDYYKMKMRMEADIAGLVERLEATKQQWV
eukprot:TRINITY_DN11739_c0_g1_i1.p1 TRINITY_DN11739_c0_g1~~TRINITY_DN11739_c0_g1_i1.p1  ORF type:complete len:812 (-),score=128.27 TRINITY_DN11739_c0_g1_i1:214-2649(-)